MPTNFNFLNSDATVKKYLDATERGLVTRWQEETNDWTFEFHEGHTDGYPLYVRSATDDSGKNLPKMLTEGKTAASYASLTSLANGGKLVSRDATGKLTNKAQKDLQAVITNSFPQLQLLAKRYWDETPVVTTPAAPARAVARAAKSKNCSNPGCKGKVPVVESGKSPCNKCYRYQ
jgi:hypothetical protein